VIADGELITLHDDEWLRRQQHSGAVVSAALREFAEHIKQHPSHLTLRELEQEALERILKADCQPTFQGYRGFPGAVCLSVNRQLVHGIPSDYELQEGDVVTMDVGATFEGAIGDAAFTTIYGKCRDPRHVELLVSCQLALHDAIETVQVGKRAGVIGHVITKRARAEGFGVVVKYGGHGLDYNRLHAKPFIPNQSTPGQGVRFQPGMAVAIEPMFVLGNPSTEIEKDGWTVLTDGIGCHFEHSVTIGLDGDQHCVTSHNMMVEDYI
jgi:methionyl aminopeptidase